MRAHRQRGWAARVLPARDACPPIGQCLKSPDRNPRGMDTARWSIAGSFRCFDRHVRPGRQPGQDEGREQLAGRQRPHALRRRRTRHGHRQRRLSRRGRAALRRRLRLVPPRRYPLSDPRPDDPACNHRRHARHFRRHYRPGSKSEPWIRPTISGCALRRPMLSKHFLSGSTPTRKSTSLAPPPRISELARWSLA